MKQRGQSVATPEQGTARADLGHGAWHSKTEGLSSITQTRERKILLKPCRNNKNPCSNPTDDFNLESQGKGSLF